jgi:hypothetical protein
MTQRLRWLIGVGLMVITSITIVALAVYAAWATLSTGTDPTRTSPMDGSLIPLTMAAVVLASATYKMATGRLFAGAWWDRVDEDMRHRGFRVATEAERADTSGIPVQLLSPPVLRTDRGGTIDHVMIGEVDGLACRSFRARIRGGRHWHDVPAIAVRVPAGLAPTMIRPGGRGVGPNRKARRRLFEHGAFNRSIEVHSTDPFVASALIDARMMDWLRQHLHRTAIEVSGGWAVAWSTSLRGPTRTPGDLLDLMLLFDEKIPRVIPSLFPRSASESRWVHRKHHAGVSALIDRFTDGATH